jgi:hypothetical protein
MTTVVATVTVATDAPVAEVAVSHPEPRVPREAKS